MSGKRLTAGSLKADLCSVCRFLCCKHSAMADLATNMMSPNAELGRDVPLYSTCITQNRCKGRRGSWDEERERRGHMHTTKREIDG